MQVATKPKAWLRKLDLDDLYILKLSHDGLRCSKIAKTLMLSFPAISQRVKKITSALGVNVFRREKGALLLTDAGAEIARQAAAAINLLILCVDSFDKEVIAEKPKRVRLQDEDSEKIECGFLGEDD